MGDWTMDRVLSMPKRVVELLNEVDARATITNRRINDLIEANNRYLQDARNWHIVEQLRAGEGHSIEIACDNPDFNGQPNSKVTCYGDWTGWYLKTFTGNTIDEALGNALVAFNKAGGTNA